MKIQLDCDGSKAASLKKKIGVGGVDSIFKLKSGLSPLEILHSNQKHNTCTCLYIFAIILNFFEFMSYFTHNYRIHA